MSGGRQDNLIAHPAGARAIWRIQAGLAIVPPSRRCGLQGLGLARSVNTTWDATRRGCELARAAGALPCLLPPRRGAT